MDLRLSIDEFFVLLRLAVLSMQFVGSVWLGFRIRVEKLAGRQLCLDLRLSTVGNCVRLRLVVSMWCNRGV